VKAQGEAKAAKMVGDAIKGSPGFLELRRLEAAREIAHTISESNNRVFLNSDALLLNVNDEGFQKRLQGLLSVDSKKK